MSLRTTPPALSQFGDLSLHIPEPITLESGIPCYIIKGGDDEMNRVNIYLNGGLMMEPKPAVSVLTALLLTEGNELLTTSEVAEKFDYYAARKSADSYDYWTEVSMTSLNENFGHTMRLLYDCITRPSFPEEELEVWKRRIAGNISVLRQRVKYVASVKMKELYYGSDTPLGRDVTPEDIMAVTRQDLVDFHKKYFTAARCKVVIAGKITDEVMATLNATIGQWKTAEAAPAQPEWVIHPSPVMHYVADKPGAMQSAVRLRITAVKRTHPDYLPLRVLVNVFGGYFGSRLMMNIREDKGYTYGIHAALLGIPNDGCIDMQCECATEHTWNVIKEVKNEMKRLREELIPEQELETVKQNMLSAMAKTHDTPYNIASYVASSILFGVYPEYHNDQLACVKSVTPALLRDLAVKYLQEDKMRVVITGDKTELERISATE